MKAILSVCFILLSISAVAQPPPPVLDIAGEELLASANYIILLVNRTARGRGLTLGINRDETCGVFITKSQYHLQRYLVPVYFRPVNPKDGVVRLSTDLNIIFNATSSSCGATTLQWKVDFDESIRRYFVSIGDPGPKTINNWFKIEKFGHAYKFVFCPSVCATCKHVCGDVRFSVQDSTNRLVLSIDTDDSPFEVFFQLEEPYIV